MLRNSDKRIFLLFKLQCEHKGKIFLDTEHPRGTQRVQLRVTYTYRGTVVIEVSGVDFCFPRDVHTTYLVER